MIFYEPRMEIEAILQKWYETKDEKQVYDAFPHIGRIYIHALICVLGGGLK